MREKIYYEELKKEKKQLEERIKEIDKTFENLEYEIYKGKFTKAIRLLTEVSNDYLNNTTTYAAVCEECNADIEIHIDDIIDGLCRIRKEEWNG